MVSALKNKGIEELRAYLLKCAKPGEWTYHSSIESDLSQLSVVEDAIREKILLRTNREVPYSVTQENLGWSEKSGVTTVVQNIYVDRVGQKTILLGPEGHTIQWIRDAAAKDVSNTLKKKVELKLIVKVRGEDKIV